MPKAFILFLILLLTVESIIGRYFSINTMNEPVSKVRAKFAAVSDTDNQADILILGDSSAGALDARRFEQVTGLSSFNAAVTGDLTVAGSYCMLREYLKYHDPPAHVVLMHVYDIWHRGPHIDQSAKAMFQVCPECIWDTEGIRKGLPEEPQWRRRFLYNIFSAALPSRLYHYEVKKWMRGPSAYRAGAGELARRHEYDIKKHKGTSFYEKMVPDILPEDSKAHLEFVNENPFRVSRWNRHYLIQMIELSRQKNIQLHLAFSPLSRTFYEKAGSSPHIRGFEAFMHETANQNENVTLMSRGFNFYDDKELSTIDHLTTEQAAGFSEAAASQLQI